MKLNPPPTSIKFLSIIALILMLTSCKAQQSQETMNENVVLGNERFLEYHAEWKNKRIGFVGNHTSLMNGVHFVDTLIKEGFQIKRLFSPEHGFRGEGDAGEKIDHSIDKKTGLPIVSLYGKNKKPSQKQLEGIDIIFFDIQDVGVRYYTYTSTLHYVMEAAAEHGIPVVVFDRPNPNGHYVDGPVLMKDYASFVGMHPVPIVHGMTIGEYANMVNEEGWLSEEIKVDLSVVPCVNYNRNAAFEVEIPPSPNLPNMRAIYLYPVLCLFEGTVVSIGRGTDAPFQQFGHPLFKGLTHTFTPKPSFGAKQPKLEGEICYGESYTKISQKELFENAGLDLSPLMKAYNLYPDSSTFFTNFFNLLAGNDELKTQIIAGKSMEEIKSSWKEELTQFKVIRKKYMLY